jgi:hypothetical protein
MEAPIMRLVRAMSLLVLSGLWVVAAEVQAGVVKTVRGEAQIIRETKAERCAEGAHLLAGDVIRTQAGASVGVILLDGTRLAIGENSEVVLKRYLFEPAADKYSLIVDIMRGICVYVSGKIGRLAPKAVEIQTPAGILGTRGTALAVKLESARR